MHSDRPNSFIRTRDAVVTALAVVVGAAAASAQDGDGRERSGGVAKADVVPGERKARTTEAPVVEVLGVDGRWTRGWLESLDARAWRLRPMGVESESVELPISGVAAAIVGSKRAGDAVPATSTLPMDAMPPVGLGVLLTIDGQRLVGSLQVAAGAAAWDHRWIGSIPLDLERLAGIRLLGDAPPAGRPDADVVRLANADVLAGFVDSIGSDVVLAPLDPADSADARRIPIERVAAIGFAEVGGAARSGGEAWTSDGSIVAMRDLRFDDASGWGFVLSDPWLAAIRPESTSDNQAADPRAILSRRERIVPLAKCELASVTRAEGEFRFGLDGAVRVGDPADRLLGLADVVIEGGVVARFDVPTTILDAMRAAGRPSGESVERRPEAMILTAEIALVEPAPGDAAVEVEVALGRGAPARFRLDRQAPRATCIMSQALAADGDADVSIRVTDGGNGLSGDRVVFRRAALLFGPQG